MKTKTSKGLMLASAVFAFCFSAIISNAQTGNPSQNLSQPNSSFVRPDAATVGAELKKAIENPKPADLAVSDDNLKDPSLSLKIEDFKLDKENYQSGDEAKGSFKLKNNSNFYSDGSYLQIELYKKGTEEPGSDKTAVESFGSAQRYDSYRVKEALNFSPQQEQSVNFSYQISKNIPAGKYVLMFGIFSPRENNLVFYSKNIAISNANQGSFVFFDSKETKVFAQNRIYRFQEGAVFNYNESYATFAEKGKTSETLKNEVKVEIPFNLEASNGFGKSTQKVSIFRYGSPLKEIFSQESNLPADKFKGNQGILDLKLPLQKEPGAYEAFVQILSDGKPVSNKLGIRYITAGDSSLIYNFLVEEKNDKDYVLYLMYTAPADLAVRDKTKLNENPAKMNFTVKEQASQKVCFSQEKEINLSNWAINLPFQLAGCQKPFVFSAEIVKDGKVLDSAQTVATEKKTENSAKSNTKTLILSVFAVFTLILILSIWLYFKKKRGNISMVLLLAFVALSGFLFSQSNLAQAAKYFDGWQGVGGWHYFNYNDGYDDDPGNPEKYSVSYYLHQESCFIDEYGTGGWECPSGYTGIDLFYGANGVGYLGYGCCPTGAVTRECPYDCYNNCASGFTKDYICPESWHTTKFYGTPIDIRTPNGRTVNTGSYPYLYITEYVNAQPNCGNGGPAGGNSYTALRAYDSSWNLVKDYGVIDNTWEDPGRYWGTAPYVGDLPNGNYYMAFENFKDFYGGQDSSDYEMRTVTNIPFTVAITMDEAKFISQTVPTTITANGTATVSITMQNCRTNSDCSNLNTWVPVTGIGDSYRIITGWGYTNPAQDIWSANNIVVPNNIPPGSSYTFTFNIKAPSTPGTYDFRWRMLQGGVSPFGELTPNTLITVVAPTAGVSCTANFNPLIVNPPGSMENFNWISSGDADGVIPYTCDGNLGSGTFAAPNGLTYFYPTTGQTCTLTVQDSSGTQSTCTAVVNTTCTSTDTSWSPDPSTICPYQTASRSISCIVQTTPGTKPHDCSNDSNVCSGVSFPSSCDINGNKSCVGKKLSSPGVCGSAANQSWSSKPNANLCDKGSDSVPVKSGNDWTWNCSGVCGGSPVSCIAKVDTNWREVAP